MQRKTIRSRQAIWGVLFVLPALTLLLLFKIVPILFSLVVSLTDYSTSRGFVKFVGLDNYKFLFSDPLFFQSLKVTVVFVVILTLAQVLLALLMAVLLQTSSKISYLFRTIFFLPVVISMSITCIIWWIMYADWGLINGILTAVGIPRQQFLSSTKWALWSLIIMLIWKGFGYWMVVFVAGLNNIPQVLYEAAAIDGATRVRQFLHVTLPLLTRVISFVVISDTTINFLIFAPAYIMTNGGPQDTTLFLAFYAYKNAFFYNDLGYACTISVVLLAIVGIVVALQFRMFRASYEY